MNAEVGTFLSYGNKKLGPKKLELIRLASPILAEYEAAGYAMTLRQLYYQMVAKNLLMNEAESYDALGGAISDGRVAGLVSWTAIEDRTRFLRGRNTYDSPADVLKSARGNYLIDRWKEQPFRPEVWVEKDALLGVIGPVCDELCVNYFACRGYGSQSELWRAGQRMAGYVQDGQRPIVFHLGDHDPSGVDMTRDNRERLESFAGVPVQVVRLALNMDQIERYRPPPNYVKPKDARTPDYIQRFGVDTCWELDALAPPVLIELIRDAVSRVRDEKLWDEALKREADDKDALDEIIEEFGR
jgi:hypothetical protein